jgi:hypothetical protein
VVSRLEGDNRVWGVGCGVWCVGCGVWGFRADEWCRVLKVTIGCGVWGLADEWCRFLIYGDEKVTSIDLL